MSIGLGTGFEGVGRLLSIVLGGHPEIGVPVCYHFAIQPESRYPTIWVKIQPHVSPHTCAVFHVQVMVSAVAEARLQSKPVRVTEVSKEQRRNGGVGETEDPEKPANQRHRPAQRFPLFALEGGEQANCSANTAPGLDCNRLSWGIYLGGNQLLPYSDFHLSDPNGDRTQFALEGGEQANCSANTAPGLDCNRLSWGIYLGGNQLLPYSDFHLSDPNGDRTQFALEGGEQANCSANTAPGLDCNRLSWGIYLGGNQLLPHSDFQDIELHTAMFADLGTSQRLMPGCTNIFPDPRSNDPSSEQGYTLFLVPIVRGALAGRNSPSLMMAQSWPEIRLRRVSQPSIHLPHSVNSPSRHTGPSACTNTNSPIHYQLLNSVSNDADDSESGGDSDVDGSSIHPKSTLSPRVRSEINVTPRNQHTKIPKNYLTFAENIFWQWHTRTRSNSQYTVRLPRRRTGLDSRWGQWSTGFLRNLPYPPPLNCCTAPHSPQFTLIGSQDHDVKNRLKLSTLILFNNVKIQNYFPSIVTNFTKRMSLRAPVQIYAGRGSDFFSKVDFKTAYFIVNRDN
ncbi:hypothetical protein PR048_000038 [Dryococelus australis]|uniref:Uncharacterized protein n=1 Tax=Dryococelus australis TaxID=614101 RepID=A0ABQ9IDI7_9NEOP|nr:hypothetical protein PR048_000038 [Dryococelus australis]